MERKSVYFDPVLGYKQNAMKLRADIVETQLEDSAARARDLEAAKEAEKQNKKGGIRAFFGRIFKR